MRAKQIAITLDNLTLIASLVLFRRQYITRKTMETPVRTRDHCVRYYKIYLHRNSGIFFFFYDKSIAKL